MHSFTDRLGDRSSVLVLRLTFILSQSLSKCIDTGGPNVPRYDGGESRIFSRALKGGTPGEH
ncbi:hypothetical protein SAMN04488550_1127 [Gordonia malaquae]|jgi:hypothetical protein|nr:hypothetical protein SAMN04488550_1127 [Gordonia malaquae]